MPQKTRVCSNCPSAIYTDNKTGLCRPCLDAKLKAIVPLPAPVQLAHDREKQRTTLELASLKYRYLESLKTIEQQERTLRGVAALKTGLDTYTIEPTKGHKTSEGTVVWVASDWHIEERVGPEVGGLNVFNLEIAKQRATRFFQVGLRLTNLLQQDCHISTIVLALLGDYISNELQGAESAEANEIGPTHAIVQAQNMLISGITFMLANSTCQIVVPCHSGNHARTTLTTRFGSENEHSLEYLMYLHLAAYFRDEPRIQFLVSESINSYLQVYDTMIRFQHGHAMRYKGGVGGLYIPVNKSIAQLNKARHADLDVFGHFHTLRDGGNFICNGSLIGYNAFALANHFDYEQPKQALFLVDKRRQRTCTWPILVGDV